MANEHAHVVDVHATVEVRDISLPPKISFSFPGLHDPLILWEELELLGWQVPDRPEAPPPEIDWNSEGGSEISVLPYRVEDFHVQPKSWPALEVAERGLNTINMLRRLGVELQIPIAYLDFLRRTQVSIMKSPTPKVDETERPTPVPNTLLLSRSPWALLVDEPSVEVYETAVAPNQKSWTWSESDRQAGELCESRVARKELLESIDMGWELVSRMEAPLALHGRDRILRFVVQDVRDGSDMLRRLKGLVGDQCASMLMRPIRSTGAVDNCLLVVAVVPAARFAEIGSQMVAEFPDAIGRGKRYSPAANNPAA